MSSQEDAQYPEHQKLEEVEDEKQVIGEFLEWFQSRGFVIVETKRNMEKRRADDPQSLELEGRRWVRLVQSPLRIKDFIAMYFNIDQKKFEEEKREMLEDI